MRLTRYITLSLSAAALAGCASSGPPFDSNPPNPPSASVLADRAALSKIQCNADASNPIVRIPPAFPPRAIRTGRTEFIFDLDDAGMPINIRITSATEEIFIRPSLKSVRKWKYAAKSPTEPESNRKNLCSRLTFRLQDARGRIIPTWDDVAAKNDTYKRYKRNQ